MKLQDQPSFNDMIDKNRSVKTLNKIVVFNCEQMKLKNVRTDTTKNIIVKNTENI